MDIYLNYKCTGANNLDGVGRDMAATSIASITEREVHRHRIALKTTWEKGLSQNFAPLSRCSLIWTSNEAILLCRISAVSEIPTQPLSYKVRPYLIKN